MRKKGEELTKRRALKDSFESTLPTDRNQKPQIDFLRFLCYNKNNNLKEDKGDAYERCD